MSGTVYSREHISFDMDRTSKSLRPSSVDSMGQFVPGANGLIKDHIGTGYPINPKANGEIYKKQTYDIGYKGNYYPVGPALQQHQVITNGIAFPNDLRPY